MTYEIKYKIIIVNVPSFIQSHHYKYQSKIKAVVYACFTLTRT